MAQRDSWMGVQVSWQAGLVIGSLALLPAPVAGLVEVLRDPNQQGAREGKDILITAVCVMLALCAVGIISRLGVARDWRARLSMLNQIALGLAVAAGAAVLTLFAERYGTFSVFGSSYYLLPTGIYIIGAVIIANAMASPPAAARATSAPMVASKPLGTANAWRPVLSYTAGMWLASLGTIVVRNRRLTDGIQVFFVIALVALAAAVAGALLFSLTSAQRPDHSSAAHRNPSAWLAFSAGVVHFALLVAVIEATLALAGRDYPILRGLTAIVIVLGFPLFAGRILSGSHERPKAGNSERSKPYGPAEWIGVITVCGGAALVAMIWYVMR